MSDILAQIGDKLGSKVKELQAQIDALGDGGSGGGGSDHTHPDPSDSYTESTFADGVLTAMTTWTNNLKSTLVSSKEFTYTNGNLTQVVVKYGDDPIILTQTIAYDGDGNVSSITKDYTLSDVEAVPWTPEYSTTLEGWWDASDATTITTSGTGVSQWNDKSGNGNDVRGSGPSPVANGLNGLQVLNFDGTADHLVSTTFVLQNAHSIYAVAKSDTNGYRRILNIEKYYYLGNGNNNNDFATFYGSGAWYSTTINTPAKSVEAHSILVAVSDGTNAIPYHNGTAQNSRSSNMGGASPTGITIGKHSAKSEHYWDGHIAEIIIFNKTHTNTEREQVEGYLAHKWGLTGNLPASHPYKSIGPKL